MLMFEHTVKELRKAGLVKVMWLSFLIDNTIGLKEIFEFVFT